MKIFILVIVIASTYAKHEERSNNGGCNISQECQQELDHYKVCQKLNGLGRQLNADSGPCIVCTDGSQCCCDGNENSRGRSDGICGISHVCQNEIQLCQGYGEDRNHMAEASLGCSDGSRCWCFMQ